MRTAVTSVTVDLFFPNVSISKKNSVDMLDPPPPRSNSGKLKV